MHRALWLLLTALPLACASTPDQRMGVVSDLSRVEGDVPFCDHRVPEPVCTRHHPELIERFKAVNDWCGPHGVPESQCFQCHPELTFEKVPELPQSADVKIAVKAGEDLPELASLAVPGKVTVLDFYADWCAPCREVDLHLSKRLARGDAFAVRKLNVVDWDSPLAKRHLANVEALPFLVVLGKDGAELARIQGLGLEELDRAIAKGNDAANGAKEGTP